MSEEDGLICAYRLDGGGGGEEIGWKEIQNWRAGEGPIWIHLNRIGEKSRDWLLQASGLDPISVDTLLAEDTRPRLVLHEESLLVILRGVNLNPGADPEDMVSIRVWIEGDRIITVRHRWLAAIQDIREGLVKGLGPKNPGGFLVSLSDRLIDRMAVVIDALDDNLDDLEDAIISDQSRELGSVVTGIRRTAIALRRYLAPQREVLSHLHLEEIGWLGDHYGMHLREIADKTTRILEGLNTVRERAVVAHDELTSQQAERMNKTMYRLTIVATVILPLSLLTGLLGINVGGIPGGTHPWGFTAVVIFLVPVAALFIWALRRLKWV